MWKNKPFEIMVKWFSPIDWINERTCHIQFIRLDFHILWNYFIIDISPKKCENTYQSSSEFGVFEEKLLIYLINFCWWRLLWSLGLAKHIFPETNIFRYIMYVKIKGSKTSKYPEAKLKLTSGKGYVFLGFLAILPQKYYVEGQY